MLSVIFLHWVATNDEKLIKTTLVSLQSVIKYTTVPYELILVSNGSTKETNNKIQEIILNAPSEPFVEVKYVNLDTNEGVSKGFNAGLKEISEHSKYISIYSNDWVCSPGWSELMIEELDEDEQCGFMTACTNHGAGSMCYDTKNPIAFNIPKIEPDDIELFTKVEIIAEHTFKAIGQTTINAFPAMGWMMKREVFNDVGLMDERIFCANDVAYYYRAKLYGWTTKTAWAPFIYHFWHASFSQINDRETYSFLKPKDAADLKLIVNDKMYKK